MSAILKIPFGFFVEKNIRYVFIDGGACQSFQQCYATLRVQLSLPDYFGNNLDALEEVLSDLDWINEEKIKIIISNADLLLAKDVSKKKDFLEILNNCDNKKLEIIYLGEETKKK